MTGIIEADECYIGGKRTSGKRGRPGPGESKAPVFALVERGGRVRAFPVERVTSENLYSILKENVKPSSRVMTAELNVYNGIGDHFASHETVNHGQKEYARGDVTTNTVEGFFGILKRGSTASIITSERSTFTATSRSSSSATTRARSTTATVPSRRSRASKASG